MRSSRILLRSSMVLTLALVVPTAVPARAYAEPTAEQLNTAREQFGAARKLEDAGRWKDALELLQKVAEVKTTPQVRFHIALCQENLGLWTQALDGYAQAAGEATGNAPAVVKESTDHIRKLEAMIPTVTLRVSGRASSDTLYLDGRPVPIDDRPLALRADPGPHSAEVKREGRIAARQYFTLEPKTTRRIELRVGEVEQPPPGFSPPKDATSSEPPASVDNAGAEKAPSSTSVPAKSKDTPDHGRRQRLLGWGAIGVSGVSAILTGVFIGLRGGAIGDLDATCPSRKGCSRDEVEPIESRGGTYSAMVNVFGVLTGAAVAGGVVLLVTAPKQPSASTDRPAAPAAALELSPIVGSAATGLRLKGSF